MTTEPRFTPPTAEELEAARQRADDLRDVMNAAYEKYAQASQEWQDAGKEHLRLAALSRPVREYVLDRFTRYAFSRKATTKLVAPHHDPAEVEKVLAEFVAEGLIRWDKRRGWVALFEGDRP